MVDKQHDQYYNSKCKEDIKLMGVKKMAKHDKNRYSWICSEITRGYTKGEFYEEFQDRLVVKKTSFLGWCAKHPEIEFKPFEQRKKDYANSFKNSSFTRLEEVHNYGWEGLATALIYTALVDQDEEFFETDLSNSILNYFKWDKNYLERRWNRE